MLEGSDPQQAIEKLIDELESFAEKSPWYMPNKIVIPDEAFFRLTQTIRERLPGELAQARELLDKRDLIVKNAQDEHRRIMESAEKRLEDLTSEEHVVVLAKQEAERIVEKAQRQAEGIRLEALGYTEQLLGEAEAEFSKALATVQKSRAFLRSELGQGSAAETPPAEPPA